MFLIVAKYLIPKGYVGITVFPFVFVKDKNYKTNLIFLNHEKIHLRQQVELLVIPFFIWYVVEYIFRLVQYKNTALAYRNSSMEREAYGNEKNLDYLKNRSLFQFLSYCRIDKPTEI